MPLHAAAELGHTDICQLLGRSADAAALVTPGNIASVASPQCMSGAVTRYACTCNGFANCTCILNTQVYPSIVRRSMAMCRCRGAGCGAAHPAAAGGEGGPPCRGAMLARRAGRRERRRRAEGTSNNWRILATTAERLAG